MDREGTDIVSTTLSNTPPASATATVVIDPAALAAVAADTTQALQAAQVTAATTDASTTAQALQALADAHGAVSPVIPPNASPALVTVLNGAHAAALGALAAVTTQVMAAKAEVVTKAQGIVTRIEAEAGVLRADVVADVGKARADLAAVESKWHLTPLTAGIVAAVLVIAGLVAGVFALPHLGVHG